MAARPRILNDLAFLPNLLARPLAQHLHDLIHAEGTNLLARGELFESGEELGDILLRGDEQEDAVDAPFWIADAFVVGAFEGIGPEVEEFGEAERGEGFLPDIETVGALFGEDEFPLVEAEGDE